MRIFIFVLFYIPIFSIAQELALNGDNVEYEKIYEHPDIPKDMLYGAAKKFIGVYFKQGKSVIQSEDVNSGLIVCKGNIDAKETYGNSIWTQTVIGDTFHFTMQFEIREGRARVKIFDIHTVYESTYSSSETSIEKSLLKEIKLINSSGEKSKPKRLDKFNKTVDLLNRTFYGILESYEEEIKEYSKNDW